MNETQAAADGRRDFDFWFGRWRIHNRRLASVLEPGCTEWVEFEATGEARPILRGLGNLDSYSAPEALPDGRSLDGMSLRLFNPDPAVADLVGFHGPARPSRPAGRGPLRRRPRPVRLRRRPARSADQGAVRLERHHGHLGTLGAGVLVRRRRELGDQLDHVHDPRGLTRP
jgi:hypothetical protein